MTFHAGTHAIQGGDTMLCRASVDSEPRKSLPKLAPLNVVETPQVHISAWARRKFRQPVKRKPEPRRELRHVQTFPAPKRLERITEEDRSDGQNQHDAWNELACSEHAQVLITADTMALKTDWKAGYCISVCSC